MHSKSWLQTSLSVRVKGGAARMAKQECHRKNSPPPFPATHTLPSQVYVNTRNTQSMRVYLYLYRACGPSSAAFRCGCCHPTGSEWEALVVMVQRGTRDEGRGQKKQKKTHTQTHTVSNRKRYKDRCKHAHAHTTNMCERKRTEHVCTCTGVGAGAGGGEATPCALLLPLSPCRRADRFNAAF